MTPAATTATGTGLAGSATSSTSASQSLSGPTAAVTGTTISSTSTASSGQNTSVSSPSAAPSTSNLLASVREWINFTTGIAFGLVFGIVGTVYAQQANVLSKRNNELERQAFLLSVKEFCQSESITVEDQATCEAHDWELSLKYMLQHVPSDGRLVKREPCTARYHTVPPGIVIGLLAQMLCAIIIGALTLGLASDLLSEWLERPVSRQHAHNRPAGSRVYKRFRGAIFGIGGCMNLPILFGMLRLPRPLSVYAILYVTFYSLSAIGATLIGVGLLPQVEHMFIETMLAAFKLLLKGIAVCLVYASDTLEIVRAFVAKMIEHDAQRSGAAPPGAEDDQHGPLMATGIARPSSAAMRYMPRRGDTMR